MCGIAGIAWTGEAPDDGAIERMARRLEHRGPDALACERLAGCHLGHARLSIIDPAGGAQPMTEETRRYWVVFNGEIYNYRELRKELEGRGWRFRTTSDTEVLLRAYQQYGQGVPSRLDGQFAFAVWDTGNRTLFAGRDRVGEKPLYWCDGGAGQILFASEIKGLVASGLVRPRIALESVDAYLALSYVPPDRTIHENVNVLPPGHALTWSAGQTRLSRYWEPRFSSDSGLSLREAAERAGALVSQAVRRQMVADVPIGAFLSGGLDSSTIVASMAAHVARPVRTFSVGFGELIDELPFARAVAERYRTEHHQIQMGIDVGPLLERMAEVYDEPFGDSSSLPTYLIAGYARRHVKVALSGDGGDEVFGGYDWYRPLLADPSMQTDAALLAAAWVAALPWRVLGRLGLPGHLRPSRVAGNDAVRAFVERWNKRRYPDFWERHLQGATFVGRDTGPLWGRTRPGDALGSLRRAFRPPDSVRGLDRAADFDARCYLPGDILVKVDRASMAHGLEVRAPFLDRELIEFVWGLPWSVRFSGGELKALLKASCAGMWPDAVRGRAKQGFGGPVETWLARDDVRSLVLRVSAAGHPLSALLPGAGRALRAPSHPMRRWTLLCLGLWLERWSSCLHRLP